MLAISRLHPVRAINNIHLHDEFSISSLFFLSLSLFRFCILSSDFAESQVSFPMNVDRFQWMSLIVCNAKYLIHFNFRSKPFGLISIWK